jgi:hypothetical protein
MNSLRNELPESGTAKDPGQRRKQHQCPTALPKPTPRSGRLFCFSITKPHEWHGAGILMKPASNVTGECYQPHHLPTGGNVTKGILLPYAEGIIRQVSKILFVRTISLGHRNIPKEFHWPVIFLSTVTRQITCPPSKLSSYETNSISYSSSAAVYLAPRLCENLTRHSSVGLALRAVRVWCFAHLARCGPGCYQWKLSRACARANLR